MNLETGLKEILTEGSQNVALTSILLDSVDHKCMNKINKINN